MENTWESRFDTLAPAVFRGVPAGVGNRRHVRKSRPEPSRLASLRERSEWPNLEIIVVDNASDDGTLTSCAKRPPPTRGSALSSTTPISDSQRRTTRDFERRPVISVLLNNDTVVSRGWLSAMIRHLAGNLRSVFSAPSSTPSETRR